MTTLPHEPKIHLGPRTRLEIQQKIEELQAQRSKQRDPYKRKDLDAKIKALLLMLTGIAAVLVPLIFVNAPPSAHAQEGYGVTQAQGPCSAYHEARQCLAAIKRFAQECVDKKRRSNYELTPEEALACINQAIEEAGATDDGESM